MSYRVKLGAVLFGQQLADLELFGRAQGQFRKKAKAGVLRASLGTKSPIFHAPDLVRFDVILRGPCPLPALDLI